MYVEQKSSSDQASKPPQKTANAFFLRFIIIISMYVLHVSKFTHRAGVVAQGLRPLAGFPEDSVSNSRIHIEAQKSHTCTTLGGQKRVSDPLCLELHMLES